MGRPRVAGTQLALLGREPNFRRLFLATLGSGAGTWLALVALEVDVWVQTHSSGWVAALLIADLLPTFAIGILVGPLVDRLSRKVLLVGSDIARFGVFAALPFTTNATQVVLLAAAAGIATGFFRPAVYAGLPNLVSDDDLSSANSLLQAVDNLTWALGSVVGGALVAASGVDAAYWLNACSFLISAVFLSGIPRGKLQETLAASHGYWADLREGFSLVLRSRALLTVLIAWNVAMLHNAAVNVAEVRLAFDAFNAGRFGLGLMMGCAGVGLAIGAYLTGRWIDRRGLANVYGASLGLMAVGVGLAAAAPNVWVAAACVVISGAGNGAAVVCNALLVQRGAPDSMRGRAFAVLMSSNVAMLTIGMIIAGHVTDLYGPRWVWGVAAATAALAAVIGFVLARGAAATDRVRSDGLAVAAHSGEAAEQSSL
jgi:MFS family permease